MPMVKFVKDDRHRGHLLSAQAMSCVLATNGSGPKPAIPFSPFSPVSPLGTEGGLTRNAAYSRPPFKTNRPVLPPMRHGAKLSRNKQRRERSDPPIGDGSPIDMPARMLAGRLRVADSISGQKGGEAGRVATEPRKLATAQPGCQKMDSIGADPG